MKFAAFTIAALGAAGIAFGSPLDAKEAGNAVAAADAHPHHLADFARPFSARAGVVTRVKKTDKVPTPKQLVPVGEMTEDQIRIELIGPPMKGNYADDQPWDETYFHDGSITYADTMNNWQGIWSFRGAGFCTYYNEGQNGGCWTILKTSANCYEFYPVARAGKLIPRKPDQRRTWTARGWRTTAASTCDVGVGV